MKQSRGKSFAEAREAEAEGCGNKRADPPAKRAIKRQRTFFG